MRAIIKTVKVFPAYAGVILVTLVTLSISEGVPRVCGGDPTIDILDIIAISCSPRMRG